MERAVNEHRNGRSGADIIACVMIFQIPFIFQSGFGSTYLVSAVALMFLMFPDWKGNNRTFLEGNKKWYWLAAGAVTWLFLFVMSMTNHMGTGLTVKGVLLIPSYLALVNYIVPVIWGTANKEFKNFIHFDKTVLKFILLMIIPFVVVGLENTWVYAQEPTYSNGNLVQLIFQLSIGAAIGEELMYRGFLYSIIKRVSNRYVGMLVSSFLFVIIHSNVILPMIQHFSFVYLLNLIIIFFLGVVNCMLYDRCKSLLVPILFHALFNGTLNYVLYMFVNIS